MTRRQYHLVLLAESIRHLPRAWRRPLHQLGVIGRRALGVISPRFYRRRYRLSPPASPVEIRQAFDELAAEWRAQHEHLRPTDAELVRFAEGSLPPGRRRQVLTWISWDLEAGRRVAELYDEAEGAGPRST